MNEKFDSHFSPDSFWKKVLETAQIAGREVIEGALTLYYCAEDPRTPIWAKGVIACALGYFILPTDAIPDFIPGAGYADDIGAILAATAALGVSITNEHIEEAQKKAAEWFGPKK